MMGVPSNKGKESKGHIWTRPINQFSWVDPIGLLEWSGTSHSQGLVGEKGSS
jgi:hypothetical protein